MARKGIGRLEGLVGTGLLLLLSFNAGCGGYYMRSAASDRAVVDLGCPSEKIEVEDVGGGAYRTTGCDKTATYVCSAADGATTVCVRERSEPASPATPKSGGELAKGDEAAKNDEAPKKQSCDPPCSPGYKCSSGTCIALCNPECTGTDVCRKDRTCGPAE